MSREDLSKGCCCQINGKSFSCLFEALLKCAWSFITNSPYGLLSFMASLQMENPSDPPTFCKGNKKSLQLCIIWIFLSSQQFYLLHCNQNACFQTSDGREKKASALGTSLLLSFLVSEPLNFRNRHCGGTSVWLDYFHSENVCM